MSRLANVRIGSCVTSAPSRILALNCTRDGGGPLQVRQSGNSTTPVIENSEPNFRKGSEAEIQTEALAAAWQAYLIPRRRERMWRKAKAAHHVLGEALQDYLAVAERKSRRQPLTASTSPRLAGHCHRFLRGSTLRPNKRWNYSVTRALKLSAKTPRRWR